MEPTHSNVLDCWPGSWGYPPCVCAFGLLYEQTEALISCKHTPKEGIFGTLSELAADAELERDSRFLCGVERKNGWWDLAACFPATLLISQEKHNALWTGWFWGEKLNQRYSTQQWACKRRKCFFLCVVEDRDGGKSKQFCFWRTRLRGGFPVYNYPLHFSRTSWTKL